MYPLVMTNIAMGNFPFIDGLPIKHGDFPWFSMAMLNIVKQPEGISPILSGH
jgi:hypothetical protein